MCVCLFFWGYYFFQNFRHSCCVHDSADGFIETWVLSLSQASKGPFLAAKTCSWKT